MADDRWGVDGSAKIVQVTFETTARAVLWDGSKEAEAAIDDLEYGDCSVSWNKDETKFGVWVYGRFNEFPLGHYVVEGGNGLGTRISSRAPEDVEVVNTFGVYEIRCAGGCGKTQRVEADDLDHAKSRVMDFSGWDPVDGASGLMCVPCVLKGMSDS